MSKRTLVSFILLVAIQTTAGAEMYRCELADGSVIYGDRRVNLSDQCQPVTAGSAEEYLSIKQGNPGRSAIAQPTVAEPTAEPAAAPAQPQAQPSVRQQWAGRWPTFRGSPALSTDILLPNLP